MRRGGAVVELALALPFLLLILLICVDGCRLFFAYTTVTNAARNGALWASDPLANGTVTPSESPYASVTAAALADTPNLSPTPTVSVSTSPPYVAGASVSVTVNYTITLLTSYLGFGSIPMSRQVTMRVAPVTPQ